MPVAVHAGSLFLEAVNRYNRQIWRSVKQGGTTTILAGAAVAPQEGIDLLENAEKLTWLMSSDEDHEQRVGLEVARRLIDPATWRRLDSAIQAMWHEGLQRVANFGSTSIAADANDLLRGLRDDAGKTAHDEV